MFDKLEGEIAKGLMSINAVKGVEFGDGFECVRQRGSEHRDELTPDGFKKNSSGGTLGGISSGQDILVSIALKPTSSIQVPGATVDKEGRATEIVTTGRHDPCVGLRATPIAEAMLALTLMDHYLRHRGAERRRPFQRARARGAARVPEAAHALPRAEARHGLVGARIMVSGSAPAARAPSRKSNENHSPRGPQIVKFRAGCLYAARFAAA